MSNTGFVTNSLVVHRSNQTLVSALSEAEKMLKSGDYLGLATLFHQTMSDEDVKKLAQIQLEALLLKLIGPEFPTTLYRGQTYRLDLSKLLKPGDSFSYACDVVAEQRKPYAASFNYRAKEFIIEICLSLDLVFESTANIRFGLKRGAMRASEKIANFEVALAPQTKKLIEAADSNSVPANVFTHAHELKNKGGAITLFAVPWGNGMGYALRVVGMKSSALSAYYSPDLTNRALTPFYNPYSGLFLSKQLPLPETGVMRFSVTPLYQKSAEQSVEVSVESIYTFLNRK